MCLQSIWHYAIPPSSGFTSYSFKSTLLAQRKYSCYLIYYSLLPVLSICFNNKRKNIRSVIYMHNNLYSFSIEWKLSWQIPFALIKDHRRMGKNFLVHSKGNVTTTLMYWFHELCTVNCVLSVLEHYSSMNFSSQSLEHHWAVAEQEKCHAIMSG